MSILSFNLSGFGLDITDRNLKLVQAVPIQHKYRLQAWGEVKLKPGIIDHGEIINKDQVLAAAQRLKDSLNGKLTSELAIVSLPETKTFLKLFKIDKPEETDKEKDPLVVGIEAELPKQIPLPVENIIYDYNVVSESKHSWEVLVGAVPRDIVLEYAELIGAMGYKPLALEIEAQAICRALLSEKKFKQSKKDKKPSKSISISKLNKFGQKEENLESTEKQPIEKHDDPHTAVIIADLGASRSSMIVYDQTIQFTRSLELSGNDLTQEISSKLDLTTSKAEQAKIVCGLDERKCKGKVAPIMKGWVSQLANELQATIDYYASLESLQQKKSVKEILLCGGSASLPGLPEILSERINLPVKTADTWYKFVEPPKKLLPIPKKSLLGFTTAIGLAIR